MSPPFSAFIGNAIRRIGRRTPAPIDQEEGPPRETQTTTTTASSQGSVRRSPTAMLRRVSSSIKRRFTPPHTTTPRDNDSDDQGDDLERGSMSPITLSWSRRRSGRRRTPGSRASASSPERDAQDESQAARPGPSSSAAAGRSAVAISITTTTAAGGGGEMAAAAASGEGGSSPAILTPTEPAGSPASFAQLSPMLCARLPAELNREIFIWATLIETLDSDRFRRRPLSVPLVSRTVFRWTRPYLMRTIAITRRGQFESFAKLLRRGSLVETEERLVGGEAKGTTSTTDKGKGKERDDSHPSATPPTSSSERLCLDRRTLASYVRHLFIDLDDSQLHQRAFMFEYPGVGVYEMVIEVVFGRLHQLEMLEIGPEIFKLLPERVDRDFRATAGRPRSELELEQRGGGGGGAPGELAGSDVRAEGEEEGPADTFDPADPGTYPLPNLRELHIVYDGKASSTFVFINSRSARFYTPPAAADDGGGLPAARVSNEDIEASRFSLPYLFGAPKLTHLYIVADDPSGKAGVSLPWSALRPGSAPTPPELQVAGRGLSTSSDGPPIALSPAEKARLAAKAEHLKRLTHLRYDTRRFSWRPPEHTAARLRSMVQAYFDRPSGDGADGTGGLIYLGLGWNTTADEVRVQDRIRYVGVGAGAGRRPAEGSEETSGRAPSMPTGTATASEATLASTSASAPVPATTAAASASSAGPKRHGSRPILRPQAPTYTDWEERLDPPPVETFEEEMRDAIRGEMGWPLVLVSPDDDALYPSSSASHGHGHRKPRVSSVRSESERLAGREERDSSSAQSQSLSTAQQVPIETRRPLFELNPSPAPWTVDRRKELFRQRADSGVGVWVRKTTTRTNRRD